VVTATRQRYAPAQFRGTQIALSGVDVATIDQAVHPQYVAGDTRALAAGQLMIDTGTATADGLTIGSPVHLIFVTGTTADLTVGAITKPPAGGGKDGSVFQVSTDTLARYVPQAKDFTVYLTTTPGTATAAGDALHRALAAYPQVAIQSQADYQNALRGQADLVVRLLYALLALAVLIAILGVINTLVLSVVERTREIGLLRAIGTSRRQTRQLIHLEAVAVAVHGALLGLALGLAWGISGQRLLSRYGITTLVIPWTTITAVLAGAVVVGLIAALLPARHAARLPVLTAIATP
jgi:putative ABC transport system permease protein